MKMNIKPLNENMKKVCVKCFDQFLEDGFLDAGRSVFYDILIKNNYISLTDKEIKVYYKKAQLALIIEEQIWSNNSKRIGFLSKQRCLTVIFKAKTLALEEFFNSLKNQGKHLTDILI